MKKIILTVLATIATTGFVRAQEQLVIETKHGSQYTFDVANISRIYFATADAIADNCEIDIEDEVVLTDCAAFEFSYDSDVETVYAGYFTAEEVREYTDEQIVDLLKNGGGYRLGKSDTMFGNSNLTEGSNYVLAYVAFNAQDQRGPLYLHPYTTSVLADIQAKKQLATVSNVTYDSQNFYFTVDADPVLVGEYYLLTEVGDDLTFLTSNMAVFGLVWKQLMEQDKKQAGQHYFGDDYTEARPNGEKLLHVMTWSTDDDWELVGYIYEGLWSISANSRAVNPVSSKIDAPDNNVFNKLQLTDQLRRSVKLYRVVKK